MPIPKERIKRINSGLFDSDVKAYFDYPLKSIFFYLYL